MERLTIEYSGDYVPKAACTINRFGEADDCKSCGEICGEAGDCKSCYLQACMNKLAEYEDAEEQGLLLRLPCKIGTTIYYVQKCMFPGTCAACNGFIVVPNCYTDYKGRIFEQKFEYRHLPAFGHSVFLTKEEAEAALQAMKEGEE